MRGHVLLATQGQELLEIPSFISGWKLKHLKPTVTTQKQQDEASRGIARMSPQIQGLGISLKIKFPRFAVGSCMLCSWL